MSLTRQVQLIFVSWIAFLGIINYLNSLPHYPLHFLSWINFSLFFFLAIMSFVIAKHDVYFWEVFLHFGFTFLLISMTVIVYFMGVDYLFGNNIQFYYAMVYSRMIVWSLMLAGTILLVLRYALWRLPRGLSYPLAYLLAFLAEYDFWLKAFTITRFPYKLGFMGAITHFFRIDVIAIVALGCYFVLLLRHNRPNGAFLHAWAIGLFVLFACDIFDLAVSFWKIDVYGIDQYFATFCLIILGGIMLLRLTSLSSDAYRLREQLIFDKRMTISTPVVLRDHFAHVIIGQLKDLISSQSIMLQLICAAGLLFISALSKQRVVLFKIFVLIVIMGTIWNIYMHVVHLRSRKGQVLNQKFIKTNVS